MDSAQFKKWFANHLKRYNAVEGWLRAKPIKGTEGVVGQNDIMEAWFGALSDVRIDDAIWATEAMFRGELAQPQGPGFDDHPRAIRRYAAQRAEQRARDGKKTVNGERVYECAACRDRGWREIWIPKFLDWAREAFGERPPNNDPASTMDWLMWHADQRAKERPKGMPYNGAVACNCAAGRHKIERGAMMFDPARHVEYDPWGLQRAIEAQAKAEF